MALFPRVDLDRQLQDVYPRILDLFDPTKKDDRLALAKCMQTSKYFQHLASPILYRTVVINANRGEPDGICRKLFAGIKTGPSAYSFDVNYDYDTDDYESEYDSEDSEEIDGMMRHVVNRAVDMLYNIEDAHVIDEDKETSTRPKDTNLVLPSAARRKLLHQHAHFRFGH